MRSPKDIFKAFTNLNILIVGDVMIDHYIWGKVNRVSPEAPVPVVDYQEETQRLGGAANVALNIKAMGAKPLLFSVIGKDHYGTTFLDLLRKHQISTQGILQSEERPTTIKSRVIAQQQHLLRIDREEKHPLSNTECADLFSTILETLDTMDIDVILFQDYNKGVLCLELIRKIILEALRRDIPTVVDPKAVNFWEYKRTTLFKPNLKEINQSLPYPIYANLESLQKATTHIQQKLGNQYTMITLSEKGIFSQQGKDGKILPTHPRQIADVCGAGDTVISLAALGLGIGLSIGDISILANLAGGQVCEKVGVVPVDQKQLMKEYLVLLEKDLIN